MRKNGFLVGDGSSFARLANELSVYVDARAKNLCLVISALGTGDPDWNYGGVLIAVSFPRVDHGHHPTDGHGYGADCVLGSALEHVGYDGAMDVLFCYHGPCDDQIDGAFLFLSYADLIAGGFHVFADHY